VSTRLGLCCHLGPCCWQPTYSTGTYQSNFDVAYLNTIIYAKLNNKDHVAKLREEYMNDVIDIMDVMLALVLEYSPQYHDCVGAFTVSYEQLAQPHVQ